MDSVDDTAEAVGCPIRKSTDQSLLAAPHGLSQRAASFIASQCQGIHQMPFRRLISTQRFSSATRRSKPATRNSLQTPCPHRHPAKMHHMTQPYALPVADSNALSGHPRSQNLFTCQRSHTRRRRIPVFSRGYRRPCNDCQVTEGHCVTLPILLVEADGIEPTTSCLQSRRSPN